MITASRGSATARYRAWTVIGLATGIVSSSLVALATTAPAFAASPPVVTAPLRVYPTENTTMQFTGADPVSAENRSMSVSGTSEGADCDDSAANEYSTDDCPQIQMQLNTGDAGLLLIPGITTKMDSDNIDHLVAPSGAVVTQSSDPDGDASQLYDFGGTEKQLNDTLATLEFVPTTDYREAQLGSGIGQLPTIDTVVINGGDGLQDEAFTEVKVEGENGAPAIVVPTTPLQATVNQEGAYVDDADVTDPELCTAAICGAPYLNRTPIADPDASMLLVAWLDSNCGRFNFGGAEFSDTGSASNNSVDSLLRNALLAENNDQGYNSDQRTAIESSFDATALNLDLSEETGGAAEDTTVFAGIGDLDNVDYALAHIDYTSPATPATCHLNVAVSDLGNDGTPISYVDSTNPTYEVPDAKSDAQRITFDVLDTHPHVTVEQTPAGDTPGVDPTHTAANYTVTFDQPVSSFDMTDIDTSGSDAGLGVSCNAVPVTPDLTWTVDCTSNKDGVIRVTVPAGKVYAQGHDGDSTYSNAASTSTDNQITWDATRPTETIDQASTQPDPASTSPIRFTVTFSEPTDPGTFTGNDIDLSQSTAGASLTATVSAPDPAHPDTFGVTVTGMTRAGVVIASVKPNGVEDLALNLNFASTSTDNSVTWSPVVGSPPAITSVSPASGTPAGGTSVTVNGSGFTGATSVKFGGTAAASLTVNSDSKITAVSPAHSAGSVNIFVTTPVGTSGTVSGDQFKFKVPVLPAVTSVSPASGSTAGGTTVTVNGSGFTGATSVKFGGSSAASFTVNSDSKITAVSPAHSAGSVNVFVSTPAGTSATVAGDQFKFKVPASPPAISSVSPTSGPTAGGTSVTITGSGFAGASSVKFGGSNAASFTVNSDSKITAVSPAHSAGSVNITVTTSAGTSSTVSGDQYKFRVPVQPAVTSVSPTSGPTAGGTTVTINGSGFAGATSVKFGGSSAASFTVNSDGTITAVSPAHTAGSVNVFVTTPGGTSSTVAGDQFKFKAT